VKSPQRVAIDAAFLNEAELRTGLQENLGALRMDADRVSARVETAFASFHPGLLNPDELERRNHVQRGADPSETLDKVIDRRVSAVRESKVRATLTIHSSGASATLITPPNGNAATVTLGPLVEFIDQRQGGLTAIGATSVGASCIAEVEADRVLAAIDGPPPGDAPDDPPDGEGVADPATVDELVERTVNRQMQSATAPEVKPEFATIPNGANGQKTQAALLQTFELRPGASDVTSYHDFNTLQIAFEHVWTQMFDGEIESLGRELYRDFVGLKDFLGYDAPDTPISTIEDLKRLMAEIKDLSQIAQADIPESLGGGPPQVDNHKGAGDLGSQVVNTGAEVLTGGLTAIIEWAINEISRAGQKPVLHWADVAGGVLNRGDRIRAAIEDGVAPPGLVELALATDVGSHWKDVAFQTYVEQAGKFVNVVDVSNAGKVVVNRNGQQVLWATSTFQSASLPIGVMEFASEEAPYQTRGRYVLAGLGERLKDRSRVTFYWTDN
jgi:hypothetical protein